MLTSETKRRINACRDILVGKLPLPTDQVELITLALIYKFMDDLDEESVSMGGTRSFFTGDLAKFRWRNLLPQTVSAEQRMTLFAEGIEALGHAQKAAHLPGLFRDIFRNAFLKFRDGRILTLFLTEVNGFAYSHSEELGNAFEYALQCMGTQGENGQFRTPRHIIDFIVACLDPQPGESVLDPACGTGGFLVSAYKHILAKHTSPGSVISGDQLTLAQRQKVYAGLAGYDITDLMVKLSKVNLFLHGFPDPAIHIYDTLSNDARWNEKADLILANPPFMTPKGGVTPHTRFRIAAKKAEVLFTDYIAEHLSADGRGGVIVPNGVVATTQNAYVKLRRFLIEDSLVAVVSLPAGVFRPYSGVKTSILLLDKKLARTAKEILFLKITADGFDLGDKRTPIAANDLPEAERVVKLWLAGKLNEKVETSLAWKAVEKKELLEQRSVNLQAEPFLGNGAAVEESSFVRLANVVEINPGKVEARALPPETEASFVPMEDLLTDRPDFVPTRTRPVGEVITGYTCFRDRDVLLAKITPCFENGKAGIAADLKNGLGFGSTEFYVLRASDKVLPEFIYQIVKRQAFRDEGTENMAGTAGQQRVRRDFIENYEIPLPPLEEQRRIVAEIEGYQKVLDGARQILAGYNPRLDIDPEWETVRLEDVCEIKRGRFSHRPRNAPQFYGGEYPFLQTGDVVRAKGRAVTHTQTLNELGLSVSKLFQPTIVLITIAANIGDTALLTYPACFTDSVVGLTPNARVLPEFLEFAMRGKKEYLDSLAPQAAQKNITVEVLREVEIPLPSLPEQQRIVAELDAEAAQMEAVRALLPRFEAKIQRVLDRVWGNGESE